jgi:hypothetical protein
MRELATEYRPQAEAIAARHPNVTPEALAEAEATLAANRPPGAAPSLADTGGIIISTLTAAALALVAGLSLISALVVPGGVVTRGLGLAVVGRDGGEVSRGRSAVRMLLAMTPAIAWFAYLAASPRVQGFVPTPESPVGATILTLAALGAGLAWTLASGARGPHDRLAGTWVIPR